MAVWLPVQSPHCHSAEAIENGKSAQIVEITLIPHIEPLPSILHIRDGHDKSNSKSWR